MGKYIMMLLGLGMLGVIGVKLMMSPAPKEKEKVSVMDANTEAYVAANEPKIIIKKEAQRLHLSAAALQRVRNATRDTDSVVRWEASRLLVALEDESSADLLFNLLHRDTDSANRRNAVGVLGEYNEPIVTRNLIRALKDTDDSVRIDVLNALGRIGDYQAAEAIGGMIHDSNERVRLKAIRTLDHLEKLRNEEIRRAKEQHAEDMRKYEEQVKKQKGG